MPQNGFHGLVGLAAARAFTGRVPSEAAASFAGGTVLGAMLPDADMYPTAIAFLAGRGDLTYTLHRTATHSLLAAGIALGIGLALRGRRPAVGWGVIGLALGIATHLLLDAFLWFAPLDLFWPLSHVPFAAGTWYWPRDGDGGSALLPVLDFWGLEHAGHATGRHLPAVIGRPDLLPNLREALELPAFACFLLALRRIRSGAGTAIAAGQTNSPPHHLTTRKLELAAWSLGAVALVTAFLLPAKWQQVLVFTPYLLVFTPYCWRLAWQSRDAVAYWSAGRG